MTDAAFHPVTPSQDVTRARSGRVPGMLPMMALAALAALCLGGCFVVREQVPADEALPGEHIRRRSPAGSRKTAGESGD